MYLMLMSLQPGNPEGRQVMGTLSFLCSPSNVFSAGIFPRWLLHSMVSLVHFLLSALYITTWNHNCVVRVLNFNYTGFSLWELNFSWCGIISMLWFSVGLGCFQWITYNFTNSKVSLRDTRLPNALHFGVMKLNTLQNILWATHSKKITVL